MKNQHPLGPSTGTAQDDSLDHHRKSEPGVPKGWSDFHQGEGSNCPWGHPHKFKFVRLLTKVDKQE